MPAIERRLVYLAVRAEPSLRGATTSLGAMSPRFSLSKQPRARRAEGLGRTTKQLSCVSNDGVVDLDLARLVRASLLCYY